jgi:hypothetical protein
MDDGCPLVDTLVDIYADTEKCYHIDVLNSQKSSSQLQKLQTYATVLKVKQYEKEEVKLDNKI